MTASFELPRCTDSQGASIKVKTVPSHCPGGQRLAASCLPPPTPASRGTHLGTSLRKGKKISPHFLLSCGPSPWIFPHNLRMSCPGTPQRPSLLQLDGWLVTGVGTSETGLSRESGLHCTVAEPERWSCGMKAAQTHRAMAQAPLSLHALRCWEELLSATSLPAQGDDTAQPRLWLNPGPE